MTQREHPYGSWPSDLTPQIVATAGTRVGDVLTDGSSVYWLESRPSEGGRSVVVTTDSAGSPYDVTGADSNVRTLVHEYGGGAWTVTNGTVFHVEMGNQQIHETLDGATRQVTTEQDSRFADLTAHPNGTHLLAVRERHGRDTEPENDLVAIDIATGASEQIFAGTDFVSSPRPGPDEQIAFITWSHPNMPWDHTELRVTTWRPGSSSNGRVLLSEQGVQQPMWVGKMLHVVTARTGWWLPHRVDLDSRSVTALIDEEIDAGVPGWVFGLRTLGHADGAICTMWQADGLAHVGWIRDGQIDEIETDFIDIDSISVGSDGRIAAAASSAAEPRCIVLIGPDGAVEYLTTPETPIDSESISRGEHITFPSHGRTAHGLLYRPASSVATGPADQLPPLLVLSHGGPTSSARPGFQLAIHFWTTRGFAVVDVNYGGSTGYGRTFRELLRDAWGIVDVQDCIAAAEYLADAGIVDRLKMAIKGGSAGGYTTLAALAFHDVFSVGASRYGIGDLETLARDTHKFESRYLDALIGPYPEARAVYVERSPIHSVDSITAPMVILQGSEDKVVPPNQAEDIVAALDRQGLAHSYVLFEGEQHGFRDAVNIARAAEVEYVFFCRVFGIEPSGDPEPLDIVHL